MMNTNTITPAQLDSMPICDIATLIKRDWKSTSKKGIYFGAVPYLEAMHCLATVNDNYGFDSGKSIIIYFLGNATAWKGETARIVKAHLKKLIK